MIIGRRGAVERDPEEARQRAGQAEGGSLQVCLQAQQHCSTAGGGGASWWSRSLHLDGAVVIVGHCI